MACKFDPKNIIKFLKDKDGAEYGPDNNPKRKGSKAASKFALYHQGMTIEEAYKAGITTAELTYDTDHNFITVTRPDGAVGSSAESEEETEKNEDEDELDEDELDEDELDEDELDEEEEDEEEQPAAHHGHPHPR